MDANKEKALAAALGQIERQFGKGTVMRMGEKAHEDIPAISTGSLGLDIALGIGGLPRQRFFRTEKIKFGRLDGIARARNGSRHLLDIFRVVDAAEGFAEQIKIRFRGNEQPCR